jgi:hypothetical protein
MLQDVLLKIQNKVIDSNIITNAQSEKLITLLKNYEKNRIVYPGTIKRHLNISMKESYEVLNILLKEGILSMCFEVYCNSCEKFQNNIYDNVKDIPEDLTCEYCGHEFNRLEDSIVVYKIR